MERSEKIHFIRVIVLAGFIFSIIFHYIEMGYNHAEYPLNTFLFNPQAQFYDFIYPYNIASDPYKIDSIGLASFPYIVTNSGVLSGDLVSASRGGPLYFPTAYRFISLFSIFPSSIAFFLYFLFAISIFLSICYRQLREKQKSDTYINVLVFAVAAYPLLITLDRSNFEIFVFFFLFIFIFYYYSHPRLSLISLVIAIAMKGFPAVFLLLYLSDRRFKEAATACVLTFAITFIGYATFPGGFYQNFINHMINLNISGRLFSNANAGLIFGHSLFGAVKYLAIFFNSTGLIDDFTRMIQTPYLVFSALAILLLAVYILFIEKIFWKKVLLMVGIICLFPTVSADYKLLHFYLPLFLFLRTEPKRQDRIFAVGFALILIPKDYFHLTALPEASVSVLFNPVIILWLIVLTVLEGLRGQTFFFIRNEINEFIQRMKIAFASTRPAAWLALAIILLPGGVISINAFNQYQKIMQAPAPDLKILRLEAQKNEDSGKWNLAMGYYLQWAGFQPENAEPYLLLANTYLQQSSWFSGFWAQSMLDNAVQTFTKALTLPYSSAEERMKAEQGLQDTLAMKGKTYFKEANFQDAYDAYLILLNRFPNNTVAMSGVVQTLGMAGEREIAIGWFKDLNKIQPQDAQGCIEEGDFESRSGNYLLAAFDYEKGTVADHGLVEAWQKAADSYMAAKSWKDLERVANNWLAMNPINQQNALNFLKIAHNYLN